MSAITSLVPWFAAPGSPQLISVSLDGEATSRMTLIYNDRRTGRQLDDKSVSYTREEVVAPIRELRHVDVYLITTLPSGAGLDFDVHDDGTIWIEFYADDGLHSATVSLATAEQVFERAYSLQQMPRTKECFTDLIEEWDY